MDPAVCIKIQKFMLKLTSNKKAQLVLSTGDILVVVLYVMPEHWAVHSKLRSFTQGVDPEGQNAKRPEGPNAYRQRQK